MPGSPLPNDKSTGTVPAVGRKGKRFIASPGSVTTVPNGTRQSRKGAMGDPTKSVTGRIAGNTNARDAQAAVIDTTWPGKRLFV